MRKAIFLGAFLLAVGSFTSCSKDEPSGGNSVDVAGTKWEANDGTTFKFYSNGTFEFTWKWSNDGDYVQLGNEINMIGQTVWYNDHLYNLRYAYVNGKTMDVEMFRALIEGSLINVTFYKVD